MAKKVNTVLLRDVLENGSYCSGTYMEGECNTATAYARGITNGVVTGIMAFTGCTFNEAIAYAKNYVGEEFSVYAVPTAWLQDWYRAVRKALPGDEVVDESSSWPVGPCSGCPEDCAQLDVCKRPERV